jgi:hypothetical protein
MLFYNFIGINIDNLYYACPCKLQCSCNYLPPRFAGSYNIFDRNGVKSNVSVDDYYKISCLARFDHAENVKDLGKKYGVLFWIIPGQNCIKILEDNYSLGIPIYDVLAAHRVLDSFADSPVLIKFESKTLPLSAGINELVEYSRQINIQKIKIIISL